MTGMKSPGLPVVQDAGRCRAAERLGPTGQGHDLASGRRVWCDLSLDLAGVGGGPVARCVVGVDPWPGALWALTWVADEARLWLASLPVVQP